MAALGVRRDSERGDEHGARRDGEEIEEWPSHQILLVVDRRCPVDRGRTINAVGRRSRNLVAVTRAVRTWRWGGIRLVATTAGAPASIRRLGGLGRFLRCGRLRGLGRFLRLRRLSCSWRLVAIGSFGSFG